MRVKTIAIGVMAALSPAVAAAQVPGCVPQSQAAALVTFALPTLVRQLAGRCGPELPRGSYLLANAGLLADRYRPDADAAWPEARRAIARVFTQFLGQEMPPEMNSDMVRIIAEPAIGTLLAKQISTDDCAAADAAVASVAALSGRDLGRLAAIAAAVADRKGSGIAGVLKVCRPEPAGR